MVFDKIIVGAGLYGFYAADFCAKRGENVLVLEYDKAPFMRATYINQARVHMGYHYPRSFSTAIKSAHYFNRFNEDFSFCVHSTFDQVYATSGRFSWTDAMQFQRFCDAAGIRCDAVSTNHYFQDGACDGAFLTQEYTYDAMILKEHFLKQLRQHGALITLQFGARIEKIVQNETHFQVKMSNGQTFETDYLLNATYASTNQVLSKIEAPVSYTPVRIKYELCEIILCEVADCFKSVGITVMDGPFFSIMPFGKTGYHSLTAVTFTPHVTSYDTLPSFSCQNQCGGICTPQQLANCNDCPAHPETAYPYMSQLARKYMQPQYSFSYVQSLFSMKPILQASEIDDSRPTVIRCMSEQPKLISVLSGKINTVYDLDEVLQK